MNREERERVGKAICFQRKEIAKLFKNLIGSIWYLCDNPSNRYRIRTISARGAELDRGYHMPSIDGWEWRNRGDYSTMSNGVLTPTDVWRRATPEQLVVQAEPVPVRPEPITTEPLAIAPLTTEEDARLELLISSAIELQYPTLSNSILRTFTFRMSR